MGKLKMPTGEQICNIIGLTLITSYSNWQTSVGVLFVIMAVHFSRNIKNK